MITRLKTTITNYLNSDKNYLIVMAIASGLYPMLYCYSRNFSLFNSLDQLLVFLIVFIGFPIILFYATNWLLNIFKLRAYNLFVFSLLNIFTFLFFIKTITYSGLQLKKTAAIIVISLFFAFILKKQLKNLLYSNIYWLF